MARQNKKSESANKTEAAATFQLVVEADADTPTYYMNHVQIAVNEHEFALWFARLPTRPSRLEMEEAASTGELVVEPEFQILVPPTLIDGLISALQQSKETHQKLFGAASEKNT